MLCRVCLTGGVLLSVCRFLDDCPNLDILLNVFLAIAVDNLADTDSLSTKKTT